MCLQYQHSFGGVNFHPALIYSFFVVMLTKYFDK